MKTGRGRGVSPLVLSLSCVICCGISLADSKSQALPSSTHYSTIHSFSSLAGKAQSQARQSFLIMGESGFVIQVVSSEKQTRTSLLSILLFLTAVEGDLNGDRQVDDWDVFLFQKYWQEILQEEPSLAVGDFDRNQIVEHKDLLLFLQYWQKRRTEPSFRIQIDLKNKETKPAVQQSQSPSLNRGSEQ